MFHALGPLTCTAAFAAAGVFDGLLLTATLRLRADHAPPHQRTQVFTIGAGLKISAAALGAALVGWVGSGSATWDLAAIAALQLVAAVVYACIRRQPALRRETPSRYSSSSSSSSSSSAVSGSRNSRKPPPAEAEAGLDRQRNGQWR